MIFRDRPFAVWGLPLVTLLLALLVLGTDASGVATRLRGLLFDNLASARPRTYQDTRAYGHPVKVLEADPSAIARYGAWPWPHATLAGMVDALKNRGAYLVVFVGTIDRPDAAAARNLTALVPPGPAYDAARQALEHLPSPDTALTTAFAGVKSVTGFTLDGDAPPANVALKSQVAWSGSRDPMPRVPATSRAAGSIEAVQAASTGLGALNLAVDADGKVRRMPLVFRFGDKALPSLDAEVLRLAEDKPVLTVKSDDGQSGLLGGPPGVLGVETARGLLATTPDGSIWMAYAGANPARMISAAALMDGTLPPDAVRDAIVYIGAPDAMIQTPLGPRPVAEVHAEAAEDLLTGSMLRRPPSAGQAELLCLALFGLGCSLLIAKFGVRWAAGYVLLVTAIIGTVSWRLYTGNGVLFDGVGLAAGLWAVWATGAAARTVEILWVRSSLKRAFTDVLPPRVIDQIARRQGSMKLEGESRTVTYLACGVRGFAELASSFRGDPAAFTRLIQRVLEPLMNEALAHGGAIDKLTADGFTAFWNAPLDDPEHAVHACEAAMGMMEAIARTNEIITHERRSDGVALDPVEIGVGLSSGPAIAGGFRVHGRTAYSVNGDCAVVAVKVQQLSGQYGPAVVVTEDTRKAAERGFAFLEVDFIEVENHDGPVKLYAMLGNPVMRASPKFRALATFHVHIFQSMRDREWHKARALIAQCRTLSGASQKLYDLHLARIAYFEANPPGEDWDGAFRPILQ
ncbi:CHASE2 domain-containing protein [Rhizomicrobium electricum]|uniref:Adenylate/guanylate cyclase domain-containing protein n=1 Tax=Rhizomicrobium electricum TaxID=480070 RepID=A0ABN1F2Y7_9PROT|nr:adenylate/guanylate cyclase domain-containing protein [Rhizomicrobium electricum]NIJ49258.1 adenylate cyclase [Rhizomicrobium electricum]